jgi:hypothetical protein
MRCTCSSPLHPVYPHCMYYLSVSYLVAVSAVRSTVVLLHHSGCVQVTLLLFNIGPKGKRFDAKKNRLTLELWQWYRACRKKYSIYTGFSADWDFRLPLGLMEGKLRVLYHTIHSFKVSFNIFSICTVVQSTPIVQPTINSKELIFIKPKWSLSQVQLHMYRILATTEADIRRITFQGQPAGGGGGS